MRYSRLRHRPHPASIVPTGPLGQAFKLTCSVSELRRALSLAKIVCEKRTTIPILAHVRLSLADGILSVEASDLDNNLCSTIAVDAFGSGAIAVPAIDFHKIVSRLTGRIELEIGTADTYLSLRAGPTAYSLACMIADDFPRPSEPEIAHAFTLQADEFRSLIGRVKYAASSKEIRYYLNGINLSALNGMLRAAATDGHRLARVEISTPEGAGGLPSISVPRKAIRLLNEIVKSDPVAFSFSVDKLFAAFHTGHVTLKSKMIDRTYPDVDRVMPKANDKVATIDAKLLSALIRRVTAACDRRMNAIRCTWEKDSLTVTMTSTLWGSANETMAVSYGGAPFELGFDFRFVSDVLRGYDGLVRMSALDSVSPVTFVDPERADAVDVLMPARIV